MRKVIKVVFRAVTIAGAVAVAAACTSGSAIVTPSAGISPSWTAAVSSRTATTAPAAASARFVFFADAVDPGLVVVGVGPGPGGRSAAQLLATSASGTAFRDIGPRVPAVQRPDSVFFLNHTVGWLATYAEDGDSSETLYRTTDGGHRWTSAPAPAHNLAVGSTDAVDFINRDDGWLVSIDANGPAEILYRTTNGGRTWHSQGQLNATPPDTRLPRLGLVTFTANTDTGWLGGIAGDHGRLNVTRDHGRTWQTAAIPATRNEQAGLPVIFRAATVEPVIECTNRATELRLYRSTDNGTRWQRASTTILANGCQQVSTALPTASAGWVTALDHRHITAMRTTDSGAHWTHATDPELTTRDAPTIIATDAAHAWLLVSGTNPTGSRIYSTSDGGRTWHRIDQNIPK